MKVTFFNLKFTFSHQKMKEAVRKVPFSKSELATHDLLHFKSLYFSEMSKNMKSNEKSDPATQVYY